jgi:predicted N-acyltransferase
MQTEIAIRIAAGIADVPAAVWDGLAGRDNPFVGHAFLSALEESGSATAKTGWRPCHLLVEGDSGLLGAVPAYAKSHSQGEYVFDHGWADAFERAGGRYYPKLQVAVPFTPATGPRLLVGAGPGAAERRSLVAVALGEVGERLGVSSVHATFLDEPDRAALAEAGWLARTDQQFHWHNAGYADFEDYLATFRSDKRKQVRRERREALAGGVRIAQLTGGDITEADWDAFFAFYMDTGSRKWGRPYLNRRFFSLLGERMADRVLLLIAYRGDTPIAGALNLIGSDALYGRYWGTTDPQPFLHFELCYHQAVDWAIAHRLARVEAGAQGDHKLARGYVPVTTHSAHFIVDPGFRRAVADYLSRERAEVARIGEALAGMTPFRRGDGG